MSVSQNPKSRAQSRSRASRIVHGTIKERPFRLLSNQETRNGTFPRNGVRKSLPPFWPPLIPQCQKTSQRQSKEKTMTTTMTMASLHACSKLELLLGQGADRRRWVPATRQNPNENVGKRETTMGAGVYPIWCVLL